VLERGFSVTQRLDDGRLVQDAGTLDPGDRVKVRFAKGEAICQVEGVHS
jgi:exonuclease VII large subunit